MSFKVCPELKWYVKDKVHHIVIDASQVPKGRDIHSGYKMDTYLKRSLDSMIYNMKKDMDFVIIISGEGDVRVGKSVLAMQIGYYVASKLRTPFDLSNVCFTSKELMRKAQEAKNPTHSIIIYDEARESLNSGMALAAVQKRLMQFFAECGQLNDLFILVLPDYFEIKKGLALQRSEILLNCYFNRRDTKNEEGESVVEKQRGFFKLFRKKEKKMLYLKGKDYLNYSAWKPYGHGSWNNIYPLDETEYRTKKKKALEDTSKGHEGLTATQLKANYTMVKGIKGLVDKGWKTNEINTLFGKERHWVAYMLSKWGKDNKSADLNVNNPPRKLILPKNKGNQYK